MTKLSVEFHYKFEKQLAKLPKKQRDKIIDAIESFLANSSEPTLRNHALKGEWTGYRSISAGGDLRAHFQITDSGKVAYFVARGTHSQLYK